MQPDTMPLGYPLSAHGATMWSREAPVAHVLLFTVMPCRFGIAPRPASAITMSPCEVPAPC